MKTKLTLFFVLLFGLICFAQNGINYKAVIKDTNGNAVANNSITVQFTILKGATQTNIYRETHAPTTDANGMVVINIGKGTPISGTFTGVDWASDDHFLNVKINTGTGLIDMGTTPFSAVPYAITATSAQNVTGLEAINEGNGIGWRLKGRDPAYYGPIGQDAVDLSIPVNLSSTLGATGDYSVALGYASQASGIGSAAIGANAKSSGPYSTALGTGTIASAFYATAMGKETTASNTNATAMGQQTTASGYNSTAMGYNTSALGSFSSAMGYNTKARSYLATAIGRYNVGTAIDQINWNSADPLFEIGNGTSILTLSNALTVLKNGNVGISTSNPTTKLHITDGSDASYSNTSGYLAIGDLDSTNLVFDNNEIMARNNGAASGLYLQHDGGAVYVGGAVVHSSDRRLKEHITDLSYGLNEIMQLHPKSYHWKGREQTTRSFGLIAQEVQSIITEIVLSKEDEDHTLSINYTELIPVLIKAMQEQQTIIEDLRTELATLKTLEQRIRQLETVSKQTTLTITENH